jgi:SAM-dependent methyltransferase
MHRFTVEAATQHFVLAEEFPEQHARLASHIRALWGGDSCEVLACPGCGLHFAWPFVAGDSAFYNLAYPYSDYPKDRWEFDRTVEALASLPERDGPVLEIGSGFGHFLRKIAPSLVRREDVVAVEYNDVARSKLVDMGFTARGEDVRSPSFDALHGRLSAVFMFQVLEHMDDLDGVIRRLNDLMRPGASVFIAVPNPHQIAYCEAFGALMDMPPNHISRWTESAFSALAARAGWAMRAHCLQPQRLRDFLRHDLVSSHMRRAQRPGTLANRVRARTRTPVRVALEGALALGAAPSRMRAWLYAARHWALLGNSAWVHFQKLENQPQAD